jgi:predicted Rossmann fold flavoprotein
MARRLGHSIVDIKPALVPLRVAADWVPSLKGVSLQDAVASVRTAGGDVLQQRREALLFTHFGLSGPSILDVSRAAAHRLASEPLTLWLDLVPTVPREDMDRRLQKASRQGRRAAATLFPDEIPRRLAETLLGVAAIPANRAGPDLSRDERRRLVNALKELTLPIVGTLGFEKAEVTSGGVALDQVDPKTLESRLVRPRRLDRRLQFPGCMEHRLAGRGAGVGRCLEGLKNSTVVPATGSLSFGHSATMRIDCCRVAEISG